MVMNEANFPSLPKNTNADKVIGVRNTENKKNKLNSVFEKPKPAATPAEKIDISDKFSNKNTNNQNNINSKFVVENKLTMLFENKAEPIKKEVKPKTNWNKKEFSKTKIDYDDEFPEL